VFLVPCCPVGVGRQLGTACSPHHHHLFPCVSRTNEHTHLVAGPSPASVRQPLAIPKDHTLGRCFQANSIALTPLAEEPASIGEDGEGGGRNFTLPSPPLMTTPLNVPWTSREINLSPCGRFLSHSQRRMPWSSLCFDCVDAQKGRYKACQVLTGQR
jgi:hypothetical protein